ncbi:hypothetical protein [Actinobacillus vicugnae]|uniref:hypothetical protein n=1 Tax=Actinobacillus vicugnae TaxID=2573093 RepID=UPI00123F9D0C|nr:hypothetical protein [Actinobacillus vicugnae]
MKTFKNEFSEKVSEAEELISSIYDLLGEVERGFRHSEFKSAHTALMKAKKIMPRVELKISILMNGLV